MNRIEPSAQFPRHRQVGDELILVVEGSNADESGVVATRNMNYRPDGCVHSVTTKNGGNGARGALRPHRAGLIQRVANFESAITDPPALLVVSDRRSSLR
jgi:hypothetical protein